MATDEPTKRDLARERRLRDYPGVSYSFLTSPKFGTHEERLRLIL